MTIKQVPLDEVVRNELSSMAYARWCKAFDDRKVIFNSTWESQGKFCPKADWPSFHAVQKDAADAELAKATKVKDAICPYSPLNEGME